MFTALFAVAALQAAVPSDYSNDANWLCRPGREDSCTVPLDATVIAPDGTRTIEKFVPAKDPKFDCFYVYPTVSTDPTPNSDMSIDQAERRVAMIQAARFRSVCRVYAPMYRQITMAALRDMMMGKPGNFDGAMAFGDVKAAFDHYMRHDNKGRGVILVGHSQGARMIQELLTRDFDGKPAAMKQLISAMPIGFNLHVAPGQKTGQLKSIPTCSTADETGCVVAYSSFRATNPPPANSRYGKSEVPGMEVVCTNPAALGGGMTPLNAYLPTASLISEPTKFAWTKDGAPVTTPFVKLPGLLSGGCVKRDGVNYFEVRINADPNDPRTDDIPGDVELGTTKLYDWGLHLIDVSLTLGDLVDLADRQAKAWAAKR